MGLKITPEDFAKLEAAIKPLDNLGMRHYASREGLSNKRYRWDLLWKSKLKIGDGIGMRGDLDLYAYLNDDHIDSALKQIVPPL